MIRGLSAPSVSAAAWGCSATFGRSEKEAAYPHDRPVSPADLAATIYDALGIDHTRLTYKFQGRHHRLTDVHGNLVRGILA